MTAKPRTAGVEGWMGLARLFIERLGPDKVGYAGAGA